MVCTCLSSSGLQSWTSKPLEDSDQPYTAICSYLDILILKTEPCAKGYTKQGQNHIMEPVSHILSGMHTMQKLPAESSADGSVNQSVTKQNARPAMTMAKQTIGHRYKPPDRITVEQTQTDLLWYRTCPYLRTCLLSSCRFLPLHSIPSGHATHLLIAEQAPP